MRRAPRKVQPTAGGIAGAKAPAHATVHILLAKTQKDLPPWATSLEQAGYEVRQLEDPTDLPVAPEPEILLIDAADDLATALALVRQIRSVLMRHPPFLGVLVHSDDVMNGGEKPLREAGASRVFQPTTAREAQVLIGVKLALGQVRASRLAEGKAVAMPLRPGLDLSGLVLVVEDDPTLAGTLARILREGGFQAVVAGDGAAAWAALARSEPLALLLDLVLPGLSGAELLRNIGTLRRAKPYPILVFTNTHSTPVDGGLLQAGATRVFRKSEADPALLLSTLRELLAVDGPDAGPARGPERAPAAPLEASAAQFRPEPTGLPNDATFIADLQKTLVEQAPTLTAEVAGLLDEAVGGDAVRPESLDGLQHRLRALAGNAGLARLQRLSSLAGALAGLTEDLRSSHARPSPSATRTLAHGIQLLTGLFTRVEEYRPESVPVLVVDDEELGRRALAHALHKVGLQPVLADSAQAALPQLRARHFDLVFLDIEMPGTNGFELCRQIRELPGYGDSPVIFVTAQALPEGSAEADRCGTDFVKKPFGLRELAAKALVCLLEG